MPLNDIHSSGADIFLHIGVHKTGSTSLQARFDERNDVLSEHAIFYPLKSLKQYHASLAFLAKQPGWDDSDKRATIDKWAALRGQINGYNGTVLCSSEAFCEAGPRQIEKLYNELKPKRLRVVICIRAIAELLPSSWQQYVKSGLTTDYQEWLQGVLGQGNRCNTPSFWRRNNYPKLLQRWQAVVGKDNVVVICVNQRDFNQVYTAFERILGLPDGVLSDKCTPPRSNHSLSWPEAELVRAFNKAYKHKLKFNIYHQVIRKGAIKAIQSQAYSPLDAIQTPLWAIREANRIASHYIKDINSSGAHIIGDLSDLLSALDEQEKAQQTSPASMPVATAATFVAGAMDAMMERFKDSTENRAH